MIIGSLVIEFRLHAVFSLKEKRKIVTSLKQKLRNKFNIAISEIEAQDSHSRLILAIVTVANQSKKVDSRLDKIMAMLEAISSEEIIDFHKEVFGA